MGGLPLYSRYIKVEFLEELRFGRETYDTNKLNIKCIEIIKKYDNYINDKENCGIIKKYEKICHYVTYKLVFLFNKIKSKY
jgi:hypothetical protein